MSDDVPKPGHLSEVALERLARAATDVLEDWTGRPQVRVSVEEAALRTGPSARNEIAGLIERGTVLSVIGRVSDWYRVRVPSELGISADTGYLHESTVTATGAEGVDDAPDRAMTLLVGVGQATPWFGFGAVYQVTDRLGVIVGVGTVPGPLSGTTLGLAAGARPSTVTTRPPSRSIWEWAIRSEVSRSSAGRRIRFRKGFQGGCPVRSPDSCPPLLLSLRPPPDPISWRCKRLAPSLPTRIQFKDRGW